MSESIDIGAVKTEHEGHGEGSEVECAWEDWAHKEGHCLPYRLAVEAEKANAACLLLGQIVDRKTEEAERLAGQVADAWDDGYRNGHAIGSADSPTARTAYDNPHRPLTSQPDQRYTAT